MFTEANKEIILKKTKMLSTFSIHDIIQINTQDTNEIKC